MGRFIHSTILVVFATLWLAKTSPLLADSNQELPGQTKDTIRIVEQTILYDTVYTYEVVYDTLWVYDTVAVSLVEGKPFAKIVLPADSNVYRLTSPLDTRFPSLATHSPWSMEMAAGMSYFLHQFSYGSAWRNADKELLKSNLNSRLGYTFSFSGEYRIKPRLAISIGVQWHRANEQLLSKGLTFAADSSLALRETSEYVWLQDTAYIYFYDNWQQGDSSDYVAYPYQYGEWQTVIDSFWVASDSVPSVPSSRANSWTYLEFPIGISYHFFSTNVDWSLETAFIPGFLIDQNRQIYQPSNSKPDTWESSRYELSSYRFDWQIGFRYARPISPQLSISIHPWVRIPLYDQARNPGFKLQSLSQGLRVGLHYHF